MATSKGRYPVRQVRRFSSRLGRGTAPRAGPPDAFRGAFGPVPGTVRDVALPARPGRAPAGRHTLRQGGRVDGFTTRPELAGSLGMVATTHWLASQTGMAVLQQGGNAAAPALAPAFVPPVTAPAAAFAAAFVLQVFEPHLNGPGGEVPILVAESSGGASVVCGQGVAPR